MIKGQTLYDYHNHVCKLIKRMISRQEHFLNEDKFIVEWLEKEGLVRHDVDLLYEVLELIETDWSDSNYSKCYPRCDDD